MFVNGRLSVFAALLGLVIVVTALCSAQAQNTYPWSSNGKYPSD
jgi:hypothetical protein